MSDIAASSAGGRFSVHFSLRHGQVLAWASLFLFAVFWNQALGWLNPDASWLIHAAHRVLDGERLHVDVWDTNPPFSVWLYLPMAWLENLTGLRAELWTSLFMFASVAAGLGLSALILRRAGLQTPAERFTLLFIIAAALLLIMPGEFAQREHFGIALALPLLFIYACRTVREGAVPVWASVLAGAMASLLLLVKPFYAAGFLLPVLYRLLVARDWKLLFIPAHFAGAAIVLAYGASLLFVFTDYVDAVMPLVVEFYLPARAPLFLILAVSASIILPVAIVTMLIGRMLEETRTGLAVFILAAIGFLLSAYMNGKAFPYHFLPVAVCLFAVLGLHAAPIIVSGRFPTRKRWLVGFASAATIGLTLLRLDIYTHREMPITDEVRALGNEVRLVSFGPNIAIGNPMARKLGAHWTERENSDLLAALIQAQIGLGRDDESGRMGKLLDAALARKVAYMRDNDVNFVLLDHKSLQWSRFVMQQPEILRALAGFRSVGCFEGTSYLVRDGLAPDEVPGADWGGLLEDECIAAGEIDPVVANGN